MHTEKHSNSIVNLSHSIIFISLPEIPCVQLTLLKSCLKFLYFENLLCDFTDLIKKWANWYMIIHDNFQVNTSYAVHIGCWIDSWSTRVPLFNGMECDLEWNDVSVIVLYYSHELFLCTKNLNSLVINELSRFLSLKWGQKNWALGLLWKSSIQRKSCSYFYI